jgi:hypothetical protein
MIDEKTIKKYEKKYPILKGYVDKTQYLKRTFGKLDPFFINMVMILSMPDFELESFPEEVIDNIITYTKQELC